MRVEELQTVEVICFRRDSAGLLSSVVTPSILGPILELRSCAGAIGAGTLHVPAGPIWYLGFS